jgi:GNAT superfamily N-acetyltransferase
MEIAENPFSRLDDYARIPIAFEVHSLLEAVLLGQGLGGIILRERPVVPPYIKDYDQLDPPLSWPRGFDLTNWGLFLAAEGGQALGGAVLAWNTPAVNMLEGCGDLAVLWDIRILPEYRRQGIGAQLFRHAVAWSRQRGCAQMKIETQNVNVNACRFYAAQGARLGDIRRFAYRSQPSVMNEIQLNWYFDC